MKYFEQAIQKSIQLVRIPSVDDRANARAGAPFGAAVAECLEQAMEIFREQGFHVVNMDGYCAYADIGSGEPFGILGHMDVVPLGQGWSHEQGEIADGVLYGRGVADDKTPVMLNLFAVRRLLDEGLTPKRTIRFILGCSEESGDWECIRHYEETQKMPQEGYSPDGDFPVIYAEKGINHFSVTIANDIPNLVSFTGGARINMVADQATAVFSTLSATAIDSAKAHGLDVQISDDSVTLTAHGRSAHGSKPSLGDNAITHMLQYLSDEFGGHVCEVLSVFGTLDGEGAGLRISDDRSGPLTMNIGVVSTVADTFSFLVDIRYPVSYSREFLYNRMNNAVTCCAVSEINNQAPLYVDRDDALVQSLLRAYNDVTGEKTVPIAIGGGTYARAIPKGVAFGPGFPGKEFGEHEVDEHAALFDLQVAYEIYYNALRELCFQGE